VETFIALLVVVISAELQKGQASGAAITSLGWVYTRTSQGFGSCREHGLRYVGVIFAGRSTGSATPAQEEAGTFGPPRRVERVGKVFTDHRNVVSPDRPVTQYDSVPQTGGHCERGHAFTARPS